MNYQALSDTDIKELFETQRGLIEVTESLMLDLFKSHLLIENDLSELSNRNKEKEAVINILQAELKLTYQQLADFQHQQKQKEE